MSLGSESLEKAIQHTKEEIRNYLAKLLEVAETNEFYQKFRVDSWDRVLEDDDAIFLAIAWEVLQELADNADSFKELVPNHMKSIADIGTTGLSAAYSLLGVKWIFIHQ